MMFRKEHGKVNITSLVERVSRFAVIMRNEDRQSTPIMEALILALVPLPADACQSITFDRGTEFSAWRHLKAGIGADAWFCDPQAPYQKGTVENTNNRLRKYLPRSTEPTALGSDDVTAPRRHQCAKVGLQRSTKESGHVEDYHGRTGSGEKCISGAWS
jgi:IS30 family transposase